MSNVIKPVYFNLNKNRKKVINTDSIMREKPEFADCHELPEDFVFIPGINVINIDQIISQQQENEEVVGEKNEDIILNASEEADKMLENAQNQAEQIKNEAYESGFSKGYDDGMATAQAETEAMKQELVDKEYVLMEEYNNILNEIEPQFAELMGNLIEKITGVVIENTDVLHYLLDRHIKDLPVSDVYYVHVSQEDYPRICGYKDELSEYVTQGSVFEIVEDTSLTANNCLIETASHMIDCSLDTQLKNLKQELRLLSIS